MRACIVAELGQVPLEEFTFVCAACGVRYSSYIRIVMLEVGIYFQEMANQSRSGADLEVLPAWVVDPNVKVFLESEGFEIAVIRNETFRLGLSDKPLIILRRISHRSNITSSRAHGDSDAYEM